MSARKIVWSAVIAVVLLAIGWRVGAQSATDNFYDQTPTYQLIDYSTATMGGNLRYDLVTAVLDPLTGFENVFFAQVNTTTEKKTGVTAVQLRRDTGVGKCIDVSSGFPVSCAMAALSHTAVYID